MSELFGLSLFVAAYVTWRYSRTIGGYVGRGPRLRALSADQLEGVSTGVRVFSVLLWAMFGGWLVVWIRSFWQS